MSRSPTPPLLSPVSAAPVRRGPVGGPAVPYRPQEFADLYLWWAILVGAGIPLSLILVGILPLIASVVLAYIILFKAWNQIQDGYQRTSAGRAVGFCFIPLFSFYWGFVAYHGLAHDMNAYVQRYGIAAPPISGGLALAFCITSLCSLIPYVGLFAMVAGVTIMFILHFQIRQTSMAIASAKLADAFLPR